MDDNPGASCTVSMAVEAEHEREMINEKPIRLI